MTKMTDSSAHKYIDVLNGKNILVVDDEPLNFVLLQEVFLPYKVNLAHAKNGENALDMTQNQTPDLILMDVMMPVINGFETCARLKAEPELEDIPVIFITALSSIDDKVRGFESGGVDYITKPIQKEEVLARVGLHLRLQEAQQQAAEEAAECSRLSVELRKFYHAFEQAKVAIIITDHDGHIEFANRAFCEHSGYSQFEVLGKTPQLLSSGMTSKETYENLWQTIKNGLPWQGELLNRKKDGRYTWEQVFITPLFADDQKLTHFLAIETNINAQKILEDRLRAETEKNTLFFEQNLMAYVEWDAELLIQSWSPGAERLFGYKEKDMLGTAGLTVLLPEAEQAALQGQMSNFFDTPQNDALQIIQSCLNQAAQNIRCEWRIVALRDHHGTVERLVSFINKTKSDMDIPEEFPIFLRKHLSAIFSAGQQCGNHTENQEKYLKLICAHSEKLLRVSDKIFKNR
jgi:PAS domain S-box-containing protein